MLALFFLGHAAKGATRWVEIAGFTLQPSEFMKPALIVLVSWMFAEGQKGEGVPGVSIAFGLYIIAVALLLVEPDVGQTVLITIAFGAAFWMAGVPMSWVMALGGIAVAGLGSTYFLFQHVASRVDRFFSHDKTLDTHQVDRAAQAIAAGGLFGRGPGEGIMKREVPDMHTDFIYSASAEEYGLWFSLILIALFMFLTLRGLFRAMRLFRSVRAGGGGGPVRVGRHAGLHQRRGESRPDADQGHDAAVHLLWRLLDAGDGPDHGHGAGADPPPPRRLRAEGSPCTSGSLRSRQP